MKEESKEDRRKNFFSFLFIFLSLFFLSDSYGLNLDLSNQLDYAPGEVLINFLPQVSRPETQTFFNKFNLREVDHIEQLNISRTEIKDNKTVFEKINEVSQDKGVKYAQPNWLYKFNQTTSKLEELQNQAAYQMVHLKEALEFMRSLNLDYSKVAVVVVDSGIKKDHPFFSPEDFYDPGKDFITDFVDIHLPLDRRIPEEDYRDKDSDPDDHIGHGTHVAGIVKTVTDGKIKIWPFRAAYYPGYLTEWAIVQSIVSAVNEAKARGIRLIFNFSFGEYEPNVLRRFVHDVIKYGQKENQAIFIASAGNNRIIGVGYPASLNEVIAVGAIDALDEVAWFSNRRKDIIYAPGVEITSPIIKGYEAWNGTSMSAPFVSGIIAYVLSINPSLSNNEIQLLLKGSAAILNPFYSGEMARKRIDAYRMLTSTYVYSVIKESYEIMDEFLKGKVNREELIITFLGNIDILINKAFLTLEAKEIIANLIENFAEGTLAINETKIEFLSNLLEYGKDFSVVGALGATLMAESLEGINKLFIEKNPKAALEIFAQTDFTPALNYIRENLNGASFTLSQLAPKFIIGIISKLILEIGENTLVSKIIESLKIHDSEIANLVMMVRLVMSQEEISLSEKDLALINSILDRYGPEMITYLFEKGNLETAYNYLKQVPPDKATKILSNTKGFIGASLILKFNNNELIEIFKEMDSIIIKDIVTNIIQMIMLFPEGKSIWLWERAGYTGIDVWPLRSALSSLSPKKIADFISQMDWRTANDFIDIIGIPEDKEASIIDTLNNLNPAIAKILKVSLHADIEDLQEINSLFGPEAVSYIINKDKFYMGEVINELFKQTDIKSQGEILKYLFKMIYARFKSEEIRQVILYFPRFIDKIKETFAGVIEEAELEMSEDIIKVLIDRYGKYEVKLKRNFKDLLREDIAELYRAKRIITSSLGNILVLTSPKRTAELFSTIDFENIFDIASEIEDGDFIKETVMEMVKIDEVKAKFVEAAYLGGKIYRMESKPSDEIIDGFIKLLIQFEPEKAATLINRVSEVANFSDWQVDYDSLNLFVEKMLAIVEGVFKERGVGYAASFLESLLNKFYYKWELDARLRRHFIGGLKGKRIIYTLINNLDLQATINLLEATRTVGQILSDGLKEGLLPLEKIAQIVGNMNKWDSVDIISDFSSVDAEIVVKIAKELGRLGYLAAAAMVKIVLELWRAPGEISKEGIVDAIKTMLNEWGPEITAYVLNINLDNAAALLEKLAVEDRARILKESDKFFEILEKMRKMSKEKVIETLKAIGPEGVIDRLNKWGETDVLEKVKWLFELDDPIGKDIIRAMIVIDVRWEFVLEMLKFIKSQQKVSDREIDILRKLVDRFKIGSVAIIIKDAELSIISALLEGLGKDRPEDAARIITSYELGYDVYVEADILWLMEPDIGGAIYGYIDDSGNIGSILWIRAYEKNQPRWLNRMILKLKETNLEFAFSTILNTARETYGSPETEEEFKANINKLRAAIGILEKDILIRILEERTLEAPWYKIDEIPEVLGLLTGPPTNEVYNPSLTVDLLLKMKPEAVSKILSEVSGGNVSGRREDVAKMLADWIVEVVKKDREFAIRVKENLDLEDKYRKRTSIFMELALFVTDESPIVSKELVEKLESLLSENHFYFESDIESNVITIAKIFERGRTEVGVQLLNKLEMGKAAKIVWNIERGIEKILNQMEYPQALEVGRGMVLLAKEEANLNKFLNILDKLNKINPQLTKDLTDILNNISVLTISGEVLGTTLTPSEDSKGGIKIEVYLLAGSVDSVQLTPIYSTVTDDSGNYKIELLFPDEFFEFFRLEGRWSSYTYMFVVKAEGLPYARVIEFPSSIIRSNFWDNNKAYHINLSQIIEPEEMKRRVIIKGKIVGPNTSNIIIDRKVDIQILDPGGISTPVFSVRSDNNGDYRVEIPIWERFKEYRRGTYKIKVEIEGYEPIEIEIPAAEAEEKLFGKVITVPPPSKLKETGLPQKETEQISIGDKLPNSSPRHPISLPQNRVPFFSPFAW